jgi:hypothetical protein
MTSVNYRTYSLTEAGTLLGVSTTTARRWLKENSSATRRRCQSLTRESIREIDLYWVASNRSIRLRSASRSKKYLPGTGLAATKIPRYDMPLERHYPIPKAARILGISRDTLHRWLVEAGYEPPSMKRPNSHPILVPRSALKRVLAMHKYHPGRWSMRVQPTSFDMVKAHVLFNRLERMKRNRMQSLTRRARGAMTVCKSAGAKDG